MVAARELAGRNGMEEFVRSYGIWIVLAAVFFAMHWFGMRCGGGHRHGSERDE
jgi:hypothetical protein